MRVAMDLLRWLLYVAYARKFGAEPIPAPDMEEYGWRI